MSFLDECRKAAARFKKKNRPMAKSCRTCAYLRVLPDADGKCRIRKDRSYQCQGPVPSLEDMKLPSSYRVGTGWNAFRWPPDRQHIEPDDPLSQNCPQWAPRLK